MVWCDNRFDYTPTGGECPCLVSGAGDTAEAAIAAWNTRATKEGT